MFFIATSCNRCNLIGVPSSAKNMRNRNSEKRWMLLRMRPACLWTVGLLGLFFFVFFFFFLLPFLLPFLIPCPVSFSLSDSHCHPGVFLVTTTNAYIPVNRIFSVNTYSWISIVHEGVSEVKERAHEWSKQAKWAELSGALQSEWAARANERT